MNSLLKTVGLLCLMLVGTTMGDYNFPSAMPPAGKTPAEVKQIVTFIWDDNAYSGLSATQYEAAPGANFASSSFIDGIAPWGNPGQTNALNLTEGMIGMSWAINTLAGIPLTPIDWDANYDYPPSSQVTYNGNIYSSGTNWPLKGTPPSENVSAWGWTDGGPVNTTRTRQNPDGTDIHFTFNLISGLLLPIWGAGWESYESKYGFFVPNAAFYPDGKILHTKVSVSWGREMYAYVGASSPNDTAGLPAGSRQGGQINLVFKKTLDLGHEVGNHTIDHMESNSPLPYKAGDAYQGNVVGTAYVDGFGRWGGEGFDNTKLDTLPWGEVGNEATEFGQVDGNPWQYMGWKMYSGKYISENAWGGAIDIAEEELDAFLGLSVAKGNLHGFRAPRLEVNSGMHFALKDRGYLYDCGQEEGYDYHVDGTNFLWPYTTDNGSPNITWQKAIGEDMTIDSMPAGLWQIPVNTMIVPNNIRPAVWANHATIARAEAAEGKGEAPTADDSLHWVENSGKVTGFDFNMFILWGMTKDNALTTLKYNLDQRIAGNKAPMQVGCHTDYFTPIYDNATLSNDANKTTYGLCLQWNDWQSRQATFEEFIDYGIGLTEDVYFYSGKETVDYINSLVDGGFEVGSTEKVLSGTWEFFNNTDLGTSSMAGNLGTDVSDITINVGAENGVEYPDAGLAKYETAGYFNGMTHLSLNYKTSVPLVVRLILSDYSYSEVSLNSVGNNVSSGLIPVSAFHQNQYGDTFTPNAITGYAPINTNDIIGVEVQALTSGQKAEVHTVSLSNLRIYTGVPSAVESTVNARQAFADVSVRGLMKNKLSLHIPTAGQYSVQLFSVDGRMVKSFQDIQLVRGVNSLNLNQLAHGMYMINIKSNVSGAHKSMKAVIR